MAKTNQQYFDFKHDPKNYRALCEPHANENAANDAIEAFWNEFYEIRNKYKIPDALVVFRIAAASSDGDETEHIGMLSAGSDLNRERLAAWAHGRASAEYKELMGRYLKIGGKS